MNQLIFYESVFVNPILEYATTVKNDNKIVNNAWTAIICQEFRIK